MSSSEAKWPRAPLERGAAANVWRNTLSQIPSVFNRLVYLSSLRDLNSGKYEHHGLALLFGDDEADRALRESHEKAFSEWLNFSLEDQRADLDLYLSSLSQDRRSTVETWLRLRPYRNLLPTRVWEPQRKLYLSDLTTLLELLKNEYGVAYPDPDA